MVGDIFKYSPHLLKVVLEKDKKKWSLPEELEDFCNENSNKFIPDKDLVDTITGDLKINILFEYRIRFEM